MIRNVLSWQTIQVQPENSQYVFDSSTMFVCTSGAQRGGHNCGLRENFGANCALDVPTRPSMALQEAGGLKSWVWRSGYKKLVKFVPAWCLLMVRSSLLPHKKASKTPRCTLNNYKRTMLQCRTGKIFHTQLLQDAQRNNKITTPKDVK